MAPGASTAQQHTLEIPLTQHARYYQHNYQHNNLKASYALFPT